MRITQTRIMSTKGHLYDEPLKLRRFVTQVSCVKHRGLCAGVF